MYIMKRSFDTGIPKPNFKKAKLATPQVKAPVVKPKLSNENKPQLPRTQAKKPPVTVSRRTPTKKKPVVSTLANIRRNPTMTTKDQLQNTKGKVMELQLSNQELATEKELLETQVTTLQEEIDTITNERDTIKNSLTQRQKEVKSLQTSLMESRHMCDTLDIQLLTKDNELSTRLSKINLLTSAVTTTQKQLEECNSKLDPLIIKHEQLEKNFKETCEQLSSTKLELEQTTKELQLTSKESNTTSITLRTTSKELELCQIELKQVTESDINQKELNKSLLAQLNETETLKRQLHNQVMELKGNIRVFCRVRPLLPSETAETNISFPESNALIFQEADQSHDGQSRMKDHFFNYDMVFPPSTTQKQVFSEISQLCQSALDGYNVCIFAYGVTSSGKTYTMQGSPSNPGMIPLSLSMLFETLPQLEQKGWEFDLNIRYVEIYNESIKDLFNLENKPDIRLLKQTTEIINCSFIKVTSMQQVQQLIHKAEKNRSVGATECNSSSSRSHSVFMLTITAKNASTSQIFEGSLNLVDLAGSERLNTSKSEGIRLKETQSINKSLSALGDVISALGKKDKHIPYRNSKVM